MFTFRHQPLKALYQVYFLTSILLRLPIWILLSAIPTLRPRRSWSFQRSLMIRATQAYVKTFFAMGFPITAGMDVEKAAQEDATETGFTWIAPLQPDQIVGEVKELAKLNDVEPATIPGYWYPPSSLSQINSSNRPVDEKVILHVHSGGHVSYSAHPKSGPAPLVCDGLIENCPNIKRVFSCDCRLSSSAPFPAKNPFPASLLDALAAYNYLLRVVGFKPENIIVCGDSSGGNTAIGLTLYLAKNNLSNLGERSLPMHGGLILISPSVEWAITHVGSDSSFVRNAKSDYCTPYFGGYTQRSLLGQLSANTALNSPWISPASLEIPKSTLEGLFQGFPRTYIVAGGGEVGLDSMRTFADRVSKDIGKANVVFNEVPDGTHDIITMPFYEPERTEVLKDIAKWLGN